MCGTPTNHPWRGARQNKIRLWPQSPCQGSPMVLWSTVTSTFISFGYFNSTVKNILKKRRKLSFARLCFVLALLLPSSVFTVSFLCGCTAFLVSAPKVALVRDKFEKRKMLICSWVTVVCKHRMPHFSILALISDTFYNKAR